MRRGYGQTMVGPMDEKTHLSASECWDRLRSVEVGRLAVSLDDVPDIFPVNYAVDRGSIVFRTAAGTKLAATDGRPVAFEVDGYDASVGVAWSVVVKGTAAHVRDLHAVFDSAELPVFPWEGGPKPYFVRIVSESITGRGFVRA